MMMELWKKNRIVFLLMHLKKLSSLSKSQNKILFGLEIFRGILYKDILTLEKQEYVKTTHNVIFSI